MSSQKQNDVRNAGDVEILDIQIPMYRVILYNDDYTAFDFVIELLNTLFHKNPADATRIAMFIHQKGKGTAGIYPKEIAEMKVSQVHQKAEDAGYPLRAGIEPDR